MKRLRKREIGCFLAFLLLLCAFVGAAHAGGGGLTGGATEWTQLANNSELAAQVSQLSEQIGNQVKQITNQIEQITNQIRMIQDMIANTMTIPDQLFRNVQKIYGSVRNIIGRTQGLAYNLANMDDELKRRFKSYADLANLSNIGNIGAEARNIVTTQMETVRTTMEAIGVSFEELVKDDASALKELQSKASSATGRNELIQATNQLMGFLAEDAMKLRQLQMMQAQMTGTVFEAERAQEDLSNARIENFFKPGPVADVNISNQSLIDRLGN